MSAPAANAGRPGTPTGARRVELPEPFSYRLKRRLLGPPLVSERLEDERLSKPLALGVLSPDCISSTAYGTEEILTGLVPAVGVAAFSLLLPVTFAVIAVLFFVTLAYRDVVMTYTRMGGAYVVARENFGVNVAQVAAAALIIDYIVTVAVQTAAGTDAVTSAFPALARYTLPITIGVVVLMCFANLRGIREAGRVFALPTYLFTAAVLLIGVVALIRFFSGDLDAHSIHQLHAVHAGSPGNGLLYGATLFVVLRSFANGGSSLTGLEAISDGVGTFRPPEGRNARRVLVIMATILGTLVLTVSFVAWRTHAVPYVGGTPTVLSQEARFVFGSGLVGKVGFYFVQAATMLILYTGGNTSFNGFPNLVSFVARDAFLPRQLARRGHRLVFSNGIVGLAAISILILIITKADVTRLVAVYAIGVFTGFTMGAGGMVRYQMRRRQPGWKRRACVTGFASFLSAVIVITFAVTKFTQGAWVVVVIFPLLVFVFVRLHHTYVVEQEALEVGVQNAIEAPVLRHHQVVVFVERLDLATARAIQYARSLSTTEPRAVHFVLDSVAAHELETQWTRLGLERISLEVLECPDRRLGRAAVELVAELAADGETEVTVLLPRRVFTGAAQLVLHDRTAERISTLVSEVPNASATIIPFAVAQTRRLRLRFGPDPVPALAGAKEQSSPTRAASSAPAVTEADIFPDGAPPGTVPIGELRYRQRARVAGRVRSVRVQPRAGVSSLECTLVDQSGQLVLVFQGRRLVPGIEPGARLIAEGMVGERARRPAMINPAYTIISRGARGAGDPER